MMKEKSYKTLKKFGQMTHRYKIKRNLWNIINISECERRSETDSDSISTIFGTTISINYRRDKRCVKNEKIVYLLAM